MTPARSRTATYKDRFERQLLTKFKEQFMGTQTRSDELMSTIPLMPGERVVSAGHTITITLGDTPEPDTDGCVNKSDFDGKRVWVQGKCGNCGALTDQLPCPYCASRPTPGNKPMRRDNSLSPEGEAVLRQCHEILVPYTETGIGEEGIHRVIELIAEVCGDHSLAIMATTIEPSTTPGCVGFDAGHETATYELEVCPSCHAQVEGNSQGQNWQCRHGHLINDSHQPLIITVVEL